MNTLSLVILIVLHEDNGFAVLGCKIIYVICIINTAFVFGASIFVLLGKVRCGSIMAQTTESIYMVKIQHIFPQKP